MAIFSSTDLLFYLFDLLAALLLAVGGVAAVMLLKNVGSVTLLVGALLGVGTSLGWIGFQVGTVGGSPQFFQAMRVIDTGASMLTAAGVLLLLLSLVGLRRRNQALESMERSPTGRMA